MKYKLIFFLIGIVLLSSGCGQKPKKVEAYVVKRGPIISTVSAPGIIDSQSALGIWAKSNGEISRITVSEGDYVGRGQLLCILKNPELDQKISQAEVDVDLAEKEVKTAPTPEDEARARARLRRSTETSNFLKGVKFIRAPIAGTVVAVKIRNQVPVPVGAELFGIADMTRPMVRARVDELDVPRVKVGQRVMITGDLFPGKELPGEVFEIGSLVAREAVVSYVETRCRINDTQGAALKPGALVDVKIEVEKHTNVLRIPKEGVLVKEHRKEVYVINSGRAKLRPIKVGLASEDYFEVLAGLSEGEKIATLGMLDLADRDRVEITKIN